MSERRKIKGVHVFSSGTWNGDQYTTEDLDEMIRAFNNTNKTVPPYLKLGHNDKQDLLSNSGMPAAGWVERLYRSGDKLYADFTDIPEKIYDLIEKRAYRKVSCEIYLDVKLEDKSYKYLIGAIALLGAETPGVMNLDDILNLYGFAASTVKTYKETFENNQLKIYSLDCTQEDGAMPKTESEIKLELEMQEAKTKLAETEAENKKFKADLEAAEKAKADLEKSQAEKEKELLDIKTKLFETDLEGKLDQLQNEKLMTPSQRQYVKALMGTEKKEYGFKEGDKEVQLSKFDVLKKLFELNKKVEDVNTEESTTDEKPEGKTSKVLHEKIEKYAKEHKITYGEAYKIVLNDKAS